MSDDMSELEEEIRKHHRLLLKSGDLWPGLLDSDGVYQGIEIGEYSKRFVGPVDDVDGAWRVLRHQ